MIHRTITMWALISADLALAVFIAAIIARIYALRLVDAAIDAYEVAVIDRINDAVAEALMDAGVMPISGPPECVVELVERDDASGWNDQDPIEIESFEVPTHGLNGRKSVIELMREAGVEPTKALTWAIGSAARKAYHERFGVLPDKTLCRKTNGKGSHDIAVYPVEFHDTIRSIIVECATRRSAA